jgi:succinate-acetate transporter protein
LVHANGSAAPRARVVTSSDGSARDAGAAARVVLRPLATPLPMGFLALALATSVFGSVQLGWIPVTQGHVAGLAALVLAAPLQLLASVFGFLSRDPVAATGLAIQGGTWGFLGLATLRSSPGATSPGVGVLLLAAAVALLIPSAAGVSKVAAGGLMALTAVRFGFTGAYELTASATWKTVAGAVGIALAVAAFYSAFALELEGTRRRTILPVGRSGLARAAAHGEEVFDPAELSREPGIRPRL